MLKDLLLSIATPFNLKRTSSRSSLSSYFSASLEEESFNKDCTLKKSPTHSRRTPKRRLSIGDTMPRTLRRKKFNSLPDPNESTLMNRNSSPITTQLDPINILVVGARNVGKSALTVRFITKRYIGDYMSGDNQTYSYQLSDEKRKQTVVFLDESNEMEEDCYLEKQLTEENLSWADGIMLVYDVGDNATFEYAKEVITFITNHSESPNESSKKKSTNEFKPLFLIGNKTDLLKRRSVTEDDIKRAAEEFPAWVTCDEVSAAEGYDDVTNCVNTLLSKVNERRRNIGGTSTKENLKTKVGSVFRHKSLKFKSRSV